MPRTAARPDAIRNTLLRQLSPGELERLRPHMVEEPLEFKQVLHEQDRPIKHVYFPNRGLVSVVTMLGDGGTVESGTVGYEGVAGVPVALGVPRSPTTAFCQIAGDAIRIPTSVVAGERERPRSGLMDVMLRYTNFMLAMLSQSAACNRLHSVDSRLARWLLMTHDRMEGDEFPLTQEFLGQMLGVQRPTVNVAGSALQRAGMIKYSRGKITVLDRQALEGAACECYAHLTKQFALSVGRIR